MLDRAVVASCRLAAARTPDGVLLEAAAAVGSLLGMSTAVNVRRPADDQFEVTHVDAPADVVDALRGERYAQENFTRMYVDEHRRADGLYFFPADAPIWAGFAGTVVTGQRGVLDAPDAWRPGDALEAVLRDRDGQILAVISADDPADGRRPTDDTLAIVAMVVEHAASALAAAVASADAADADREAQELQHLSASLAAGLDETAILERAVEGLCLACGFESALLAIAEPDRGCLRAVAAVGAPGGALGLRIPADRLDAALAGAIRISESSLVPHDASLPIRELGIHRSTRFGAGTRGWKRDLLVVPLASGVGQPLGVILVDDPVDRLRPSVGKVRRMELFARNAALLVTSARALAAARAQATSDPLTALGNRRSFRTALEAAGDAPISLALVDLDRFKRINDAEGHLRGDDVLRELADAIGATLPVRGRAFRFGGDEFAILVEGACADGLVAWTDALREAAPGLAFSAGVAQAPGDAPAGDALVQAADTALYAAKRAGRGRTVRFLARPVPQADAALSRALERVAHADEPAASLLAGMVDGLAASLGATHAGFWERDGSGASTCRYAWPAGDVGRDAAPDRRRRVAGLLEPVVVHVDDADLDPEEAAELRATGSASVAFIPILAGRVPAGHIELGFPGHGGPTHLDLEHAIGVAALAGLALAREADARAIEAAYRDTVGALATALDAKDADTGDHARAIVALAGAVARRLGLAEPAVREVEYAALCHDMGKIATPSEVLRKPGPLTAGERRVVEEHVEHGARILERIGFLRAIAPAVRHSHERWDGRGYPAGLRGEEIPHASRIVFACDTWHAMTTDRPYRAAGPRAAAVAELERVAGSQLDPAVVRALTAELAERGWT